jgi:hypothetical protein
MKIARDERSGKRRRLYTYPFSVTSLAVPKAMPDLSRLNMSVDNMALERELVSLASGGAVVQRKLRPGQKGGI